MLVITASASQKRLLHREMAHLVAAHQNNAVATYNESVDVLCCALYMPLLLLKWSWSYYSRRNAANYELCGDVVSIYERAAINSARGYEQKKKITPPRTKKNPFYFQGLHSTANVQRCRMWNLMLSAVKIFITVLQLANDYRPLARSKLIVCTTTKRAQHKCVRRRCSDMPYSSRQYCVTCIYRLYSCVCSCLIKIFVNSRTE